MKTDSIFYQLFQSYPVAFFQLIGVSDQVAISYAFHSVKVKQLAFRIDGVFTSDLPDTPIYFAEVQFQNDDRFYQRTLSEIMLYLGQSDADRGWQFVILFANKNIAPKLPKAYKILEPNINVIYLNELGDMTQQTLGVRIVDLVVCKPKQAQEKVQQLLPEARNLQDFSLRESMLNLIETILIYKFEKLSRKELETMFGLSELKQTRFYQEAKEEGIQVGIQTGRQEGIQVGRQEGEVKLLMRLLSRRFGQLSNHHRSQITTLSLEQIEELGEALLDFTTIENLDSWLANVH